MGVTLSERERMRCPALPPPTPPSRAIFCGGAYTNTNGEGEINEDVPDSALLSTDSELFHRMPPHVQPEVV